MEKPLVTVLMPCYNAMPFLPEALESMMNQTYRNLEILCINDGSCDETGKVLDEYAAKDARIKVIHNEENIRLIRTLNKGIELAKGEYIARMDADDISFPERIEKELEYMQANPEVDIVSCGVVNINTKGEFVSNKIIRSKSRLANLFASFFYVPIGHPELLIKTEVLRKNPFLYADYVLHTEDYELWSRLLRLGYDLRNIDTPLLYFRINPESVSRKYTDIQNANFVECARRHIEAYSGRLIDIEVMHVVVNRIPEDLSPEYIRRGLRKLKWIRQDFFIKEGNKMSKEIQKETAIVYNTHFFDICVQIFKRTSFRNKVFVVGMLLRNADMFFKKEVRKYIREKF